MACCIRRSAASALARAEPGKLRGFAGGLSGCPASRSFQGHSMTVDSYAYCPAAGAVMGFSTPTLIETGRSGAARAGIRQEAGR
ncbi:hypothetical protein F7R13_01500 [Burkholderia territorii]|uniref:Uncharacterized protein n=1 Tax=Burkholderia territorii TaxID=1503055 RepID=A0A6L3NNH6_9BURK|nr:hypothetical protein F7R13_01500 [Burkholderia territorii]TXG13721.1 hypothetical protein FU139_17020 [Burkholderia territorii]